LNPSIRRKIADPRKRNRRSNTEGLRRAADARLCVGSECDADARWLPHCCIKCGHFSCPQAHSKVEYMDGPASERVSLRLPGPTTRDRAPQRQCGYGAKPASRPEGSQSKQYSQGTLLNRQWSTSNAVQQLTWTQERSENAHYNFRPSAMAVGLNILSLELLLRSYP
jgi:hypothetical protein